MAFIPAYKHETAPVPFEYYPAGAIQNLVPGTLLYVTSGKLAVAGGTTKPQFIAHHTGTTAAGDLIAVEKIKESTIYETTCSAAFTSINVGNKVTTSTDGLKVTATTESGVATVVDYDGTAIGSKVRVRFE